MGNSNLFFNAYIQADLFGKTIFLTLFILSIVTWVIIIHKSKIIRKTRRLMIISNTIFNKQQNNPLTSLNIPQTKRNILNSIHSLIRKYTINILNKNCSQTSHNHLSKADIDFIDLNCSSHISQEIALLDKNLFILSIITSLAPFLGLLGTVWGILITFSGLQTYGFSQDSSVILSGLSTALTTTVLGLLIAIPALIGYSCLKHVIKDIEKESERFSTILLTIIEMQYRKTDLS